MRLLSSAPLERPRGLWWKPVVRGLTPFAIPPQVPGPPAPPSSDRIGFLRRCFLWLAGRQDDFSPSLFDRRDRRLRGTGDFDRDRSAQLPLGQQADAI